MSDKVVARQSFVYLDDDGKRKSVHRGTTWMDADHPVVKCYPHRFGPDEPYPGRSREWHERKT